MLGSQFKGIKFTMMKKAWRPEHEVAGQIMSAVRKQEDEKEIGLGHQILRPASSDPLPPTRLHLLKVPQPLKQHSQLRTKCPNT